MYYTVIKHDGHLRTRGKCRKHEPQASVSYISRVFSNVHSVYHSVIHGLGFFICFKMDFTREKTIKHAFSMFYTLIKHGFLTNQSARWVPSIF